MAEHKVATQAEWEKARAALLEREEELARLAREVTEERRKLPWVPVEKEYTFDTEDGQKTLAELFDGRSQLLAYHLMFGPDYTGACPGCSSLADHFDGGVVHLNHRDVTFLAISRAPLEKLTAYKRRMEWRFPWVSSASSDFNYDFGFAMTPKQMRSDDMQKLINEPADFLVEWSADVGTDLETGLVEGPGWNAFATADGVIHHTYSCFAPDGNLLAPYYYQLLDQVPKGRGDEYRVRRHDEY